MPPPLEIISTSFSYVVPNHPPTSATPSFLPSFLPSPEFGQPRERVKRGHPAGLVHSLRDHEAGCRHLDGMTATLANNFPLLFLTSADAAGEHELGALVVRTQDLVDEDAALVVDQRTAGRN